MNITYGDTILLAAKDRKQYVRTLTEGGNLTTHLGTIQFDDLNGLPYGSAVKTHRGSLFYLLRPTSVDLIAHGRHETAIIQPKDLGYIALKLGIKPGTRVIEAGSGSGALTLTLATLVGDSGRVYSFDRHAEIYKVALKNLNRAGVAHRVTFTERDITAGFELTDADALFLDVPTPQDYLAQARAALSGGGTFGAIVPTINQLIDLVQALYAGDWFMIEVEEILLRSYKLTETRIRPHDEMVGHTGFLIFARAVHRNRNEVAQNDPS